MVLWCVDTSSLSIHPWTCNDTTGRAATTEIRCPSLKPQALRNCGYMYSHTHTRTSLIGCHRTRRGTTLYTQPNPLTHSQCTDRTAGSVVQAVKHLIIADIYTPHGHYNERRSHPTIHHTTPPTQLCINTTDRTCKMSIAFQRFTNKGQ